MTYAMLRLARAVYPEKAFIVNDGRVYSIYCEFDPANNSEQFVDVLAWLLRQRPMHWYDGEERRVWIELVAGQIHKTIYAEGEYITLQTWNHDCTPAGIRAAVVEAAVRVANA